MDLTIEQVKTMSIETIYNYLYTDIYNYYYRYNYVNIPFKNIKNKFIKEIMSSKYIYDGNVPYKEFIKNKIVNYMKEETKKAFKNKDKRKKIINYYLNKNFNDKKNYRINIQKINHFELFLNEYNCILNQDELISIIKNNILLQNSIKIIFEENKKDIIIGKMENLFNNQFIKLLIETYCLINNIEIIDTNVKENSECLTDFSMYFKNIGQYNILTREEEINLFKQIEQGNSEARKIIIKHNLKLVANIAKKYKGKSLEFEDLIQEGNIGLVRAIDKFDYKKGYKFSTYATYWIDAMIKKGISKSSRIIQLSKEKINNIIYYNKVKDDLYSKLNREPNSFEIANKMGVSLEELYELEYIIYQQHLVSIDATILNCQDNTLEEVLKSNMGNPEIEYKRKELSYLVLNLLENSNLTEKELKVVKLKFGFNNNKEMTLEDIGKEMGYTKQRISQILKLAMEKLKKEFAENYLLEEKQLKSKGWVK